jgi:acyl-ACP thioesterase
MEQIYEQELFITPSLADARGRLSWPGAFTVCQDLAGIHAERLGVGLGAMAEKSLFWLTVRTKIVFRERPGIEEHVTLRTWAEKPGAARCSRSYEIARGEEILVCGKTEWAVIRTDTGRLCPMAGIFPAEVELAAEPQYPAPFARINPDFSGAEALGSYTVRSTDIDLGGHMNNVAYLRALLGTLSGQELAAMPQGELEIVFRTPCFEGETLRVLRRPTETGWELAALKPDGTPAVFVKADR